MPEHKEKENTEKKTSLTPEKAEEKEKQLSQSQKVKIAFLGALTLGAGILSWLSLHRVLTNGLQLEADKILSSLITLLFPVFSFCLWVALVGIVAVFVNKRWLRNVIYFSSLIFCLAFFGLSIYTLLVVLIIFLGFLFFARGVRKERDDRIKFHILNFIKVHLMFTLLICVMGVAILFYAQIVDEERAGDQEIEAMLAGNIANLINIFLESQFETYDPSMTLDEFVLLSGEEFIAKIGSQLGEEVAVQESFKNEELLRQIDAAIASGEVKKEDLPQSVLEKYEAGVLTAQDLYEAEATALFNEQLMAARDDFLNQIGVEATGDETISSVIKKFIAKQLESGLSSYEKIIPPVLAISLFLSLAIFNFLYSIFTAIFALLIYMIFLLTGFIKVRKENREVEIAEIK